MKRTGQWEIDAQLRILDEFEKRKGMDSLSGRQFPCLMFYRGFKIQEQTEVGHRHKKLSFIF